MAAPTDVQFPAGESFADVRARVAGVLADVATAASAGPRSVVVVTHGGPIRAALVQALGMNPAHAFRLAHDCAAVSCIDYYTSGCVVRAVNWLP